MVLDLSFLTRPRIDFSRFKTIQNIRKSFDLFMGYNESLTLEDKIMGSLHQKSTNSMLNIIGQYSGEIINDLQGYDVLSANITQVVNQAKQILFEEFSEYVVGDTSISLSELIDVQYKIEQIRSKNSHTDFYEWKPVLIVNGQRRELQGLELYTKVGSKSGPEIMMPKLQARKDDFPRVQNAIDMNQIGNMIIMTPLTKTPLFETYEYLHDLGVTTENLEFFSTIVDYVRLRNIAVSKERWNRFSHEVSKGYKKIDADIVTKFFSRTKKAYQLFGGLGGINLGALDYASKRLSRFSKYESIKIDEEEANNWIDLDSLLCLMSSGENIDEINYLLDNARLGNINDLKTVTNAIIKSISRNDYGTLGEIKDGKKLVYMYPIGSDLSLVALSPSTNGKWGFSNLGKSLSPRPDKLITTMLFASKFLASLM